MGDYAESTIRVILFSGKKGDWLAWEERFLAKAKQKGFKELLLGRVEIPVSDTVIADTPEGVNTRRIMDLNDRAYSELILSMDIEQSGGKVAFSIIKGSKSTEYVDGNGAVAWSQLTAKYAPKTAPSMVKPKENFDQVN
jgi:hypothetical protein